MAGRRQESHPRSSFRAISASVGPSLVQKRTRLLGRGQAHRPHEIAARRCRPGSCPTTSCRTSTRNCLRWALIGNSAYSCCSVSVNDVLRAQRDRVLRRHRAGRARGSWRAPADRARSRRRCARPICLVHIAAQIRAAYGKCGLRLEFWNSVGRTGRAVGPVVVRRRSPGRLGSDRADCARQQRRVALEVREVHPAVVGHRDRERAGQSAAAAQLRLVLQADEVPARAAVAQNLRQRRARCARRRRHVAGDRTQGRLQRARTESTCESQLVRRDVVERADRAVQGVGCRACSFGASARRAGAGPRCSARCAAWPGRAGRRPRAGPECRRGRCRRRRPWHRARSRTAGRDRAARPAVHQAGPLVRV